MIYRLAPPPPQPPAPFDETISDTTRCAHVPLPSLVRAQTLWREIWKNEFGEIKIREHKQVDGKDRKRAELRRLLRRTVTRNKTARDLIKQLRQLYRDSLRRERTFYWCARLLPARYPNLHATYIQDGATQT